MILAICAVIAVLCLAVAIQYVTQRIERRRFQKMRERMGERASDRIKLVP
jgi:hypothetical protein